MAFFLTTDAGALLKGRKDFEIKVPINASRALSDKPKRVQALIQEYVQAISRSLIAGRLVSFRVDVDPEGETVVTIVDEEATTVPGEDSLPDAELEQALATARADA